MADLRRMLGRDALDGIKAPGIDRDDRIENLAQERRDLVSS